MHEWIMYSYKKEYPQLDSTSSTVWNIVIVMQIMIPTPR